MALSFSNWACHLKNLDGNRTCHQIISSSPIAVLALSPSNWASPHKISSSQIAVIALSPSNWACHQKIRVPRGKNHEYSDYSCSPVIFQLGSQIVVVALALQQNLPTVAVVALSPSTLPVLVALALDVALFYTDNLLPIEMTKSTWRLTRVWCPSSAPPSLFFRRASGLVPEGTTLSSPHFSFLHVLLLSPKFLLGGYCTH